MESCLLAELLGRKRMGEPCASLDPALIFLYAGFTGADMLDGVVKGCVNSKQSASSVEAIYISLDAWFGKISPNYCQ